MATSILQEYPKFVSWKTDATTGLKVRNAGGTVTFSKTGTSTAKDAYTSQDKSTALANPATLDSAGELTIYLDTDELYRFVIKDSDGNTIDTIDEIGSVSASSATSTLSGSNLVPNGSFEDDADGDGTPDEWTTTNIGTSAIDTTDSYHGIQSMKFTSTGSGGGDVESPYIDIDEDRDLALSFFLKSSDAGVKNIVTVEFFDQAQASLSTATPYSDATTNPTSWTLKSFTVTTPASAVQCKVKLVGCDSSDATAGSTWYDGVILTQAAIAPSLVVGPSPSVTDQGSGTVNTAGHIYYSGEVITSDEVSGFVHGWSNFIENTVGGDSTTMDVDAVIGASWESVGPTGSSATNIWTALDSVPTTAKYVIIKSLCAISTSAAGGHDLILYARKTGDSTGIGLALTIGKAAASVPTGDSASTSDVCVSFVPVDANIRFDLYLDTSSGQTADIVLVGWGE